MPSIRENESVGPYRTIQPFPTLHKDDLVEAWLSQPPDEREEVVLNILRIPPDGLDEKHRRAYKALENEVKILKGARHLNIVRIYPLHSEVVDPLGEGYLSKVRIQDETWWLWAMEHLEGGSLASMIERLGRLSLQEAAEVTYQIAMALDYIHSKGIVHLNVCPQNVFFRHPLPDPNPRVELVLAGFASAAGADQEVVDEGMAEVEFKSYVPPERIKPGKVSSDQSLDNRPQDIYLLGVLFYHMLAGAPPFTGSDEDIRRAILGSDPPPLPRLGVPAEIGNLIFQALGKDPAGRPSLEHLLISLDKNVPPPRATEFREDARRRAPAEGAPAGVESVLPPAPAPSFSERLKARWSAIFRKTPPAPKLLEPEDKATLEGSVTFTWEWKGELKDDRAFELRIWKEGGPHDSVGELPREPDLEIDLDALVPDLPGEGDECFWNVAVVQISPYRTLSKEAKPRSFVYGEPSGQEEMGEGTDEMADVETNEGN